MPVVAVIGGIASASAGVAAFSAAAGFTLANVVAGLQIVGGIASTLGAVTGNQKLMKVGMVASLGATAVGAVSSLVSGAAEVGGLGLAADAAPSMVDEFGNATGQGISAAKVANVGLGNGLGSELSGLDTGVGALGDSGGALAPSANYGLASSAAPAGTGLLSQALPGLPQRGAQQSLTPSMDALAGGDGAGFDLKSAGNAVPVSLSEPVAGTAAPQQGLELSRTQSIQDATRALGAQDTGGGVFSKFGSLLNKNPELVKLGAGVIGGVGQGYMANEQYKMQQQAEEAKRRRMNESVMGIQVQRGGV